MMRGGWFPGTRPSTRRRVQRTLARPIATAPTFWQRLLRWFLDGVW